MTIIAVHGSLMVADSFAWSGHYGYPCGAPKIVRAPDGSLVGASGLWRDCIALHEWVRAGMNFSAPPKFLYEYDPRDEGDASLDWLWLRPDRSVWRVGTDMLPMPMVTGVCVGSSTACLVAEAAMAAGANVIRAVKFAIERCKD